MNITMKNYQSKLSIITLAVLTSLGAQAGSVTSTFNNGDTLTATQMTEIKNAVNDNDTRVATFFAGDGSAGDLTVSALVNWSTAPPGNPYFANITIEVGQTLIVPAGTTIRCSGNFTNNGTLAVSLNENSGFHFHSLNELQDVTQFQHPGDSIRSAGFPDSNNVYTTLPTTLSGGSGGIGIPRTKALTSYNRFNYGGGGGSGHQAGAGGDGGGLVKIFCNGIISNFGVINADGQNANGGGGGGGGIVVLASLTEINNDAVATITANGGAGHDAQSNNGIAGGGGGGIIILAAPSIINSGTNTVLGGIAGVAAGTITSAQSSGGGGGGASGGNGGAGGSVSGAGIQNAASNGSDGHIIEITALPILN